MVVDKMDVIIGPMPQVTDIVTDPFLTLQGWGEVSVFLSINSETCWAFFA